jgi:hypothetical protein
MTDPQAAREREIASPDPAEPGRQRISVSALADAMAQVWALSGREDIGAEAWSGFAAATLGRLHYRAASTVEPQ